MITNPKIFDWLEAHAEEYGLHGGFSRGTGGVDAEYVLPKLFAALDREAAMPGAENYLISDDELSDIAASEHTQQIVRAMATELLERRSSAAKPGISEWEEPVAWQALDDAGHGVAFTSGKKTVETWRANNMAFRSLYASPSPLQPVRDADRAEWHPASEPPKVDGIYECWVTGVPPQSHPLQVVRFTKRREWITSWGPPSHWRELTRPPASISEQML